MCACFCFCFSGAQGCKLHLVQHFCPLLHLARAERDVPAGREPTGWNVSRVVSLGGTSPIAPFSFRLAVQPRRFRRGDDQTVFSRGYGLCCCSSGAFQSGMPLCRGCPSLYSLFLFLLILLFRLLLLILFLLCFSVTLLLSFYLSLFYFFFVFFLFFWRQVRYDL